MIGEILLGEPKDILLNVLSLLVLVTQAATSTPTWVLVLVGVSVAVVNLARAYHYIKKK